MKTNILPYCWILTILAVPTSIAAELDTPHIGYVYPAGGRQGSSFEVLLGGQHLDGTDGIYVSGDGVQARVLEYLRPLNQGQFKEMQNRMGEFAKKKAAAAPEGWTRGSAQTFINEQWTAEDEKELVEIRKRLSTFTIRKTSVPALVETVKLQVTISTDAQPGQREFRLRTERGLTNPLIFCVGQLPEFTEDSARNFAEEESHQRGGRGRQRRPTEIEEQLPPGTAPIKAVPKIPIPVTLPVTINGQILPGDADQYTFAAKKGQEFIVDVSARKLIPYLPDTVPGWFQAAVTRLDADGKEIAFDDDFRFHPDPVLHCQIPADGQYIVEIRDALYRGREDFIYRMALGQLPFITDIFPLGGRIGEQNRIELHGWNLPSSIRTQTFGKSGVHSISVLQDGQVSNHVPFAVDSLPECFEQEPNNDPDSARQIALPQIVNGRMDQPGDVDVFCFQAKAGQTICARVNARRLGSSMDSMLKLFSPQGEQLAFNDDFEDKAAGLTTHHADSKISAMIPEDGLYALHLGDTQFNSGQDCTYRLYINTQQPDFDLRIVPSAINARAGTTVPFTVHALRTDGFTGDITLSIKDAPPGLTLSGNRIPAGRDILRMTLTVPAESRSEPYRLFLEGRGSVQGRPIVRSAAGAEDMTQAFIYRHLVPAKELLVSVYGSPSRYPISVPNTEPVQIPLGRTAAVPVSVPSRSFFGEVQIELDDPPPGITLDNFTSGRRGGQIILHADASAAETGMSGNLIANVYAAKTGQDTGKGKEQRKKRKILLSTLPAIPFEIVNP